MAKGCYKELGKRNGALLDPAFRNGYETLMLVVNAEGKSSTLKKRVNAATVPQGRNRVKALKPNRKLGTHVEAGVSSF
jgi:hypothetical protein